MTKAVDNLTIPETPEELAEFVSDPDKWAKLGDPDTRKEFLAQYNRAVNKGDAISKQVTEQVTATVVDFLKDNGVTDRPDMSEMAKELANKLNPETLGGGGAQRSAAYNPRAMGAQLDDEFESSADYFRTIWHNTDKTTDISAKLTRIRNAFSENVPSEGGFLVPETLRAELLKVSLETSIVRSRARVVPMESLRVPFPAVDGNDHTGSVFGGIIAYWTEEGATLTESNPKFGRIVLDAKKLTAYTEVPNELVSDSISSFQMFIDELFPEALAWYEDIAFLNGGGTGEPLGVFQAPAKVDVTRAGSNAIAAADIYSMYSRMLPSSLGRAVWVANQETLPQLLALSHIIENQAGNDNVGGSHIGLVQPSGIAGTPAMTILGRPLLITEKASALGSAGDLSFIDFGFYLIGDRQVMSARSSEHNKFQQDMTSYRIIERVDGRPWLQSAITPKNGSNTLSPFVRLGTT